MDNDLRSLLIKAVQKGLDEGKVTAEDVKMHLQAQGLYEKAADPKCLVIPTPKPRDVHIKVKILRDLDKKPTEGIYPSRGYGFADFSSHVHALAALRHVNNNPAFSSNAIKAGAGKRSRLIVSFAVENHKALQKKILRGEKVRTAAAPEATKGTRTPAAAAAGLKRKLASEAAGQGEGEEKTEKKQKMKGDEDPAEKRKSRGQRQRERKRQRKEAGEEDEAPRRSSGRQPKGDANGEGKLRKAAAALQQKRGGEKKTSATDLPKKNGRGQRGGADPHKQEDEELTRLAAAAAAANGGEPGVKKGGRRKSAGGQETKEDKHFAQTVSAYKQKLLGGGGGGGAGEDAKGPQKRERWFE
jgi:nucleolar protein 4